MTDGPVFLDWPLEQGQVHTSGAFGATHSPWSASNPHRGIDQAPNRPLGNLPIILQAPGRVLRIGTPETTTFGNAPVIDHGPVFRWRYTIYAHCRRVNVTVGEILPAGVELGRTGSTGQSSGEHLHLQLSDSPWFPRDMAHAANYEDYIIQEDPDVTLAEDTVLATYAHPDELDALKAGTMTRAEVLEQAAGRVQMILERFPFYVPPFWTIGDHLPLPKHGGAAADEHTHEHGGPPRYPHTHLTYPPIEEPDPKEKS